MKKIHWPGMKLFWYTPLLMTLCLILTCFHIGDRDGRVNPYDPNGDNWFPPTVDILDTLLTAGVNDTVAVKVKTSDKNGTVEFLDWMSVPEAVDTIDSITGFNYSIVIYDTVISVDKDTVDTNYDSDTVFYDSALSFIKTESGDSIVYTLTIDSLHKDTLVYDTASDTTFFKDWQDSDSIYFVYMVVKIKEFVTENKIDTTFVVDSAYYIYSSRFTFDATGLFELYVTAIDNDGIESECADSVTVIIADTVTTLLPVLHKRKCAFTDNADP